MKDTTELRDKLAKMYGWEKRRDDSAMEFWASAADAMRLCHPIPDTLDCAASAMPVGWTWGKWGDGIWVAHCRADTQVAVEVVDTGDEKYDRFKLAIECHEIEAKRSKV